MTEWHPIDTAPTDGTYVLVFDRKGNYRVDRQKYYDFCNRFINTWEGYSENPSLYTHWMPLPNPPEIESE